MKKENPLSEMAKTLGKRGGIATVKKYGKEHFKKIRKLSKNSGWIGKKKKQVKK